MNTRVQIVSIFLGTLLVVPGVALATYNTSARVTPTASPTPIPLERKRELLHETVQARQTELETKLSAHNQEISKRLQNKINERNQALVIILTHVADRWAAILAKMESRLALLQQAKVDTSAAEAAITKAHQALDTFNEALKTQRQKEYTVDLVGTDTIREALQTTFEQFKSDHQQLRQNTLKTVQEALRAAFEQLLLLANLHTLSP